MTGGILQLAAYGKQDEILMADPEITYFKTVFRKYTHFSSDISISKYDTKYNSSNEIQIPKTGELLYKLYVKLELPEIYAYYKSTLDEDIYNIVNTNIYNYTYDIFNTNVSCLTILNDLIKSLNAQLNYNKLLTQYFSYFDQNMNIHNIFSTYETANMMHLDYNKNNIHTITNTSYYENRLILKNSPITSTTDLMAEFGYNYNFVNFLNEKNYYDTSDITYENNYVQMYKSINDMIYLNKSYLNILNQLIFNIINESIYNILIYDVLTSYIFFDKFKNQLYINTMLDTYLRQVYTLTNYGNYDIDDIMLNVKVSGQIMTYDNELTNVPQYLVYVDKNDVNILVPIILTDITEYKPDSYSTMSKYYYNYTGYIQNVTYYDQLIKYLVKYTTEINYLKLGIQFDKIVISKSNNTYHNIALNLSVLNIVQSKSFDNLSYLYTITIDTTTIETTNNASTINVINSIIQTITNNKYIIFMYNYTNRSTYKTYNNNQTYNLPPCCILLLDPDNPPIYTQELGFVIYCKNSAKPYNMSNLKILSPYVPISVKINTEYSLDDKSIYKFLTSYSTDTDYKLQINYLNANNLSTSAAANTVISYPQLLFKIFNQFYNTSPLTIKNTINKSDLTINLDMEYNTNQLSTYKNNLNLNMMSDNTLYDQTSTNFTTYYNSLLNSYQYISSDSINENVLMTTLKMYTLIYNLKSSATIYPTPNAITILPSSKSFDITSIFKIAFYENKKIIPITLTYNDIQLTQLNQIMTNIIKLRFYPLNADPTNKNPIINTFFTPDQLSYIQPDSLICAKITIPYDQSYYMIKYIYTFQEIIAKNTSFVDIYVNATYEYYINNVQQIPTPSIDNLPIWVQQLFSYYPTINNMSYVAYSITNPDILFSIYYTDQYPLPTGNILNFTLKLYDYYLSDLLITSSIENILFIKTKYENIYDIIPTPNYFYGKFNYDTLNLIISSDINNIFIHDIYIQMLYIAYINILNGCNSTIGNVISLIIQDLSYLLSSFFKDPALILNGYTSYEEIYDSSNNLMSLEDLALITTNYTTFNNYNYNLLNTFTPCLMLDTTNIYNSSNLLSKRLDNYFYNYINNSILFNQISLTNIISPILIANNEKYLNINTLLPYFDHNYSSSNVFNVLNIMGYPASVDSMGNSISLPNPLYVGSDPTPYYLLTTSTTIQILNQLPIYTSSIDPNKKILLKIFLNLKNNLTETPSDQYFDVQSNFIDPIINVNSIYYNSMTYSELFNLINITIKSYFQIFLTRSNVLSSCINPELEYSSISHIIIMFMSSISNYTNSESIINCLNNLTNANIININVQTSIVNQTIGFNLNDIYVLQPDFNSLDELHVKNSLSYYRGNKLLNEIKSTILININEFKKCAQNILTSYDVIKTEELSNSIMTNEIYNEKLELSIESINIKLTNMTYYTILQSTTTNQITIKLQIFDFNTIINNIINSNIKLIYLDSDENLIINSVLTCNSTNTVQNLIYDNIDQFNQNDFINQIVNTNLMYNRPDLVNNFIDLYNISASNGSLSTIFTQSFITSIVNLANTTAYISIQSVIDKLTTIINDLTNVSDNVSNTSAKLLNPLEYDFQIYMTDMSYQDKIFYLYNWFITQLYLNEDILFADKYDSTQIYNNYMIFYNGDVNTYGPVLQTNFSISNYNVNTNTTIYQFFNSDYYIGITLKNIISLFNYFANVVNYTIKTTQPFTTKLANLFMKYVDNSTYYEIIGGLFDFIDKYCKNYSSIDQQTLNLIISNPITNIIYTNMNIFVLILTNIANLYNISDLMNNKYSIVNNQTFVLYNINKQNPSYVVAYLPNIVTYTTDTLNSSISTNQLISYLYGVLKYNVDISSYINFAQLIDEQKRAFVSMFTNIMNMNNIGINSQGSVDFYSQFAPFNLNAEIINSQFFNQISLTSDVGLQSTANFKTNYTLLNITSSNDIYYALIQIARNYKSNLSHYVANISNITFGSSILEFDKYYSDIEGFYNYIINDIKPSTYIINLLTIIYDNNVGMDITTLKNYTNLLLKMVGQNKMIDIISKKSFIVSDLIQTIDLFNFNLYFNYANSNSTDLIYLFDDMKKLSDMSYSGPNAGNIFNLYNPSLNIKSIIINDHIDNYYTTNMMQYETKSYMLLMSSNKKVSDKITDAVNSYINLSKLEQLNIIRLYSDMKKINGILYYLLLTNQTIDELKNYPINSNIYQITSNTRYVYNQILMTLDEYNLIFSDPLIYNFNSGSIGILIYDKITGLKININQIYLISKLNQSDSATYEFILFRKTDLPNEYIYIFDSETTNITSINLRHSIDNYFTFLYNHISIMSNDNLCLSSLNISLIMIYSNLNLKQILLNLNIYDVAKILNNIEYTSNLHAINKTGELLVKINQILFDLTKIQPIELMNNIFNSVKLFNNLYYGSYLQTQFFLTYDSNYIANLTIHLANLNLPSVPNQKNSNQLLNLYAQMFLSNQNQTLLLIQMIIWLESNFYLTTYGTQIMNFIISENNIILSLPSLLFVPIKLHIQINNDISNLTFFVLNLSKYNIDYVANFIINLYNYNLSIISNTNNTVSNIYPILNPVLILARDILTNYESIYITIMGKILYLNFKYINDIRSYAELNYNSTINIIPIYCSYMNILNDNSNNYLNLINSDEQNQIYLYDQIITLFDLNNNIIGFEINNVNLSESEQLVRINYQTDLSDINQTKSPILCQINNILNLTSSIFVNYPYELIFKQSIANYINILNDRMTYNITYIDYNRSINIYYNDVIEIYESKYIDYENDFFIKNIIINGISVPIIDILFSPYETTDNCSIDSLYPISNVMKIQYYNRQQFKINKNYMNTSFVEFYINNLNLLYLSTNYIIKDDETMLRPRIIGIDKTNVIININPISNISNIESIGFGLINILNPILNWSNNTTLIDSDLIHIYIDQFNQSNQMNLTELLGKIHTQTLINQITNYKINLTKIKIINNNFNSKYYIKLGKNMSNINLLNNMINSLANDKINSNLNLLNNVFIPIYPSLIKTQSNYELKIFNLNDNWNPNTNIQNILNEFALNEVSNSINLELLNNSNRDKLTIDILLLADRPNIPKFSYISHLADFIFNKIIFKIDGTIVDEINQSYMFIYHNLLTTLNQRIGYNLKNSNNEKLLLDTESKPSFELFIEIPLYWTQIPGLSFPLIAAIFSNLIINFNINSLEDLTICSKYVGLKYKNRIKMTVIYNVMYLDDYERQLFSTLRHEYLYQRKLYNTPIQLNVNTQLQNRCHISFEHPIKDFFYYLQLQKIIDAKQYYNFTFEYMLPELYMNTKNKILYLQQMITNKYTDTDITNLYNKLINIMMDKIFKIKYMASNLDLINLGFDLTNLRFLANNLTEFETSIIDAEFDNYYKIKLNQSQIINSTLYFNSVQRFSYSDRYTNWIVPFQSYNNMIPGLHIYNFSLHPNEYQPSGSANFSSIKPEFAITLSDKIYFLKSTDILNLYMIARGYNIMRFISGHAGMAWK